jgi:hypothetical protein
MLATNPMTSVRGFDWSITARSTCLCWGYLFLPALFQVKDKTEVLLLIKCCSIVFQVFLWNLPGSHIPRIRPSTEPAYLSSRIQPICTKSCDQDFTVVLLFLNRDYIDWSRRDGTTDEEAKTNISKQQRHLINKRLYRRLLRSPSSGVCILASTNASGKNRRSFAGSEAIDFQDRNIACSHASSSMTIPRRREKQEAITL